MDRDGIKTLLKAARDSFPRLSHVWLEAAYNGQEKGADWVEKVLGWSAEIVRHRRKLAPEEIVGLVCSSHARYFTELPLHDTFSDSFLTEF